jgi:fructuronate reductase
VDVTPTWTRREPAPPVRLVHLGLGAFARAHLLAYTERANAAVPAGDRWGVAGFTGRSPDVARSLAAQDGRYTLVERSADGDRAAVVDALAEVHDGADAATWRALLARPEVGVLSLTVTEAGYRRGPDGRLDLGDPDVTADLAALRAGTATTTAPARVLDGLRARRAAAAGPIAVVSCDNLPGNGAALRRVVLGLADRVDAGLAAWVRAEVSFVSTTVDRITPATTDADRDAVRALTGRDDRSPVVAEPFAEWVLQGAFPGGRPAWDRAGARFVTDIAPYEHRKLWLLNAGHSLLAYAGLPRGLRTVADAVADPALRARLEALWAEARAVLPLDPAEVDDALAALRTRFANPRIEHRLDQIARDGSQKLPVRVLDVARERRAAGLPAGTAGAGVLADWVRHLVDRDGARTDPGAAELADRLRAIDRQPAPGVAQAAAVLAGLAPDLTDDAASVRAVAAALDAALTTAR